jgi:hypothetical protein
MSHLRLISRNLNFNLEWRIVPVLFCLINKLQKQYILKLQLSGLQQITFDSLHFLSVAQRHVAREDFFN